MPKTRSSIYNLALSLSIPFEAGNTSLKGDQMSAELPLVIARCCCWEWKEAQQMCKIYSELRERFEFNADATQVCLCVFVCRNEMDIGRCVCVCELRGWLA